MPLFKELNQKGNIIVRLQKKGNGSSLFDLAEDDGYVILEGVREPMTCFSYDGTMFAYLGWEEPDKISSKWLAREVFDRVGRAAKNSNPMKLKHLMRSIQGMPEDSRSDPKTNDVKKDQLIPVLTVLKTDGKEATELIHELKAGQRDHSVFYARVPLAGHDCDFDLDWLKSLKNLQFDMNNNFLIGVGKTDFFMLDLREARDRPDSLGLSFKKIKNFSLEPIYEEIKSIKFCTNGVLDDEIFKDFVSDKCTNTRVSIDREDHRCFIAAKVKG